MATDNDYSTGHRAARGGVVRRFVDSIADLGDFVLRSLEGLGDITLFIWRTLRWMFTRLPRRETLFSNMYQIGVLSLPVVALTGTFIGMVLAVQSYTQFRSFGLETQLGGVINKTMFRELGPVLAATMLAGRVGSAMAAELGTMRVTEQIDALSSMGANPIQYLVVPRFLSCLLLIPSLTIMAVFMGAVGGEFYCVFILGIDSYHYQDNAQRFVPTVCRNLGFVLRCGEKHLFWCDDRLGELLSGLPLPAGSRGRGQRGNRCFCPFVCRHYCVGFAKHFHGQNLRAVLAHEPRFVGWINGG